MSTLSAKTGILLILIAILALDSIFSGAGYLEWRLPGGLPWGNALAAIGLSAAAGAGCAISSPNSVLRWVSAPSLLLALAWLPISIALAGNLALNFAEETGQAWVRFTAVTFALAAICLVWAITRAIKRAISQRLARPGSGGAG